MFNQDLQERPRAFPEDLPYFLLLEYLPSVMSLKGPTGSPGLPEPCLKNTGHHFQDSQEPQQGAQAPGSLSFFHVDREEYTRERGPTCGSEWLSCLQQ